MLNYKKELFENLKINFHNYSQCDFKSAVEGNTRTDMSENDKFTSKFKVKVSQKVQSLLKSL